MKKYIYNNDSLLEVTMDLLDKHLQNGWWDGCQYGMADGYDDYITDCECPEDKHGSN